VLIDGIWDVMFLMEYVPGWLLCEISNVMPPRDEGGEDNFICKLSSYVQFITRLLIIY